MRKYRYEVKFSLDDVGYTEAMRWMFVDTHAVKKYNNRYVNSLYFDNPGYSSIRDNITGLSNRSKYRLRWYHTIDCNQEDLSRYTFEKKTRKGRLGKKYFVGLSNFNADIEEMPIYKIEANVRNELISNGTIVLDDHYSSTLYVNYLREYYADNLGLRITFDKDIKFSYVDGLTQELKNCPTIYYRKNIMELKFDASLKNYVSELIRTLRIPPTRHSKYLMGLSKFGSILYI